MPSRPRAHLTVIHVFFGKVFSNGSTAFVTPMFLDSRVVPIQSIHSEIIAEALIDRLQISSIERRKQGREYEAMVKSSRLAILGVLISVKSLSLLSSLQVPQRTPADPSLRSG